MAISLSSSRALAVAFALGLALSACKTAPIYEVRLRDHAAGPGASLDEIGDAVEHAALSQKWRTRRVKPGRVFATKRRGPHAAHVTIDYDVSTVTIELLRSTALSEGDGRIHKTYNRWIRSLEERIVFETESVR